VITAYTLEGKPLTADKRLGERNNSHMAQNGFPPSWDEERVQKVPARYETQAEEEAVAEDEADFERSGQTVMEVPSVPSELVPAARELITKHGK